MKPEEIKALKEQFIPLCKNMDRDEYYDAVSYKFNDILLSECVEKCINIVSEFTAEKQQQIDQQAKEIEGLKALCRHKDVIIESSEKSYAALKERADGFEKALRRLHEQDYDNSDPSEAFYAIETIVKEALTANKAEGSEE